MTVVGEVVRKVGAWNPSRAASSEPFAYVDLSSVDQDAKRITAARSTLPAEAPSRARQLIERGDVLVSTVRPNLNAVAYVGDEFHGATASTGFTVLRPTDRVDGRYLFHWVQTPDFVQDMARKATGASYPAVSDRIVKESSLPLPPIEEQRRIAAILDHTDRLKASARGRVMVANGLAGAMFRQSFADCPTTDLGNHLAFVTSGGRGWSKHYAAEGSRFIRSLDVRDGHLSDADLAYVAPPDNAEARRTKVQTDDVLLTITGSRIGRSARVDGDWAGGYVSQHVAILRPNGVSLRSEFLTLLLGLPEVGQRLIHRSQYGQTKPGLNFEQIRAFALPVPEVDLQDTFLAALRGAKRLTEAARDEVVRLDLLRASLQARAFSGRL